MSIETKRPRKVVITPDCLNLLARDAFHGTNEKLAEKIKAALSYEEGGRQHPANGFTLADAIKTVAALDAGDVLDCVERLTVRLTHEESDGMATELLH
ncbi:MAG TPA: hypothetical protein VK308_09135, partial [Pyrinomonadaceae bacterium]|nr:hypothetical protein [Pyrinomonadaceae bacterium]